MLAVAPLRESSRSARACPTCGIPVDSKHFDESKIVAPPEPGREVQLARFELPPQYCGVLEYFSQYTNVHASDASRVSTAGLRWQILSNRQVLYPYTDLQAIVNPWGFGSFPMALRLAEGATLEFVVRREQAGGQKELEDIKYVGGRIAGRFWYDTAFGGVSGRSGG